MIARKQEGASKHAPEYRGGEWWCHGKPMWVPPSQPFTRICNVRAGPRGSFGVWSLCDLREMVEADSSAK